MFALGGFCLHQKAVLFFYRCKLLKRKPESSTMFLNHTFLPMPITLGVISACNKIYLTKINSSLRRICIFIQFHRYTSDTSFSGNARLLNLAANLSLFFWFCHSTFNHSCRVVRLIQKFTLKFTLLKLLTSFETAMLQYT